MLGLLRRETPEDQLLDQAGAGERRVIQGVLGRQGGLLFQSKGVGVGVAGSGVGVGVAGSGVGVGVAVSVPVGVDAGGAIEATAAAFGSVARAESGDKRDDGQRTDDRSREEPLASLTANESGNRPDNGRDREQNA